MRARPASRPRRRRPRPRRWWPTRHSRSRCGAPRRPGRPAGAGPRRPCRRARDRRRAACGSEGAPGRPRHLDDRGRGLAAPTRWSSMRHSASTGAPSGPATVVTCLVPPSASSRPSPPSDIGTSSAVQPAAAGRAGDGGGHLRCRWPCPGTCRARRRGGAPELGTQATLPNRPSRGATR